MTVVRSRRIGGHTIDEHASGLVVTRFDDGAEVLAWPHGTAEYAKRARDMGYGDDDAARFAMSRAHETAHALLAVAAGLHESPVLASVARCQPMDETLAGLEEAAVLAFSHWVQAMGRTT